MNPCALPPLDGASMLPPLDQAAPPEQAPKAKAHAAGRFGVLNDFVDHAMSSLPRNEVTVWMALVRDTKQNGLARTSQADLARRCGCNERTVRRALTGLKENGLVTEVRKGRLGAGASEYRVSAMPAARGR